MKCLSILRLLVVQPLLAAALPVDSDSESSPPRGDLVVVPGTGIPSARVDGRTATPDVYLESPRPYYWDLFTDRPTIKHPDPATDVVDVDDSRPVIHNGPRGAQDTIRQDGPQPKPHDLAIRQTASSDSGSDMSGYPRFTESEYSSFPKPEFKPSCTRRSVALWTRREWEIRWDGDHDPNGFDVCGEKVLWGLMEKFFCLPLKGTWECKRIEGGHGGEGQVVVAFVTGVGCRARAVEGAVKKGTGGRVELRCGKW